MVVERRRFLRAKERIFLLCYVDRSTDPIEVITEDIGGGGVMFSSERELLPSTKLEIDMYQPVYSHNRRYIISISSIGEIVWLEKIGCGNGLTGVNKFRIGMRFVAIDSIDRDIIIRYIEEKRKGG